MIRWSYNVQLQHTHPQLWPDASETKVWRTCADRLTDPQQPQTCEDWISKDSSVSAHEHWGGKYTLWQAAISISAGHMSLVYISLWHQKGQYGRNLSFSLNSRINNGSVGFETQINPVSQEQRVGNPVYAFHMCDHADIVHIWQTVAVLQEGGEKWLSATTAKQIPPPLLQIWYWIQPDPAHNIHRCEHPDGLFVGLSYKWTG